MSFFGDSSDSDDAQPSKSIPTFESDSDEHDESAKITFKTSSKKDDNDYDELDNFMSALAEDTKKEEDSTANNIDSTSSVSHDDTNKRKRSERLDMSSDDDDEKVDAGYSKPKRHNKPKINNATVTTTTQSLPPATVQRLVTPLANPSSYASVPASLVKAHLASLSATVSPSTSILPLGPPPLPSLSSYNLESPYTNPTPIQSALTPLLLAGHACTATSPTGTGKTLSYCIPLLPHLTSHSLSCLVLAPTRELSTQIAGVLRSLTRKPVLCIYGGQTTEASSKWAVAKRLKKVR